jgi:hypothetical protein
VSNRGPIIRSLMTVGGLGGLVLALAGGIALRASGVIAVLLAGLVAACLGTGIAREIPGRGRWAPLETAVQAGAVTIGVLLLISGTAAVAGGVVAAVTTAAGAVTALVVRLVRGSRHEPGVARRRPPAPARSDDLPRPYRPLPPLPWHAAPPAGAPRADVTGSARLLPPVCDLTTDALGQEWLRTTAVLAGPLEPAIRSSIVGRRQEALDELERRDQAGFARWLAAGPVPGSDPASFVRGGPSAGRAPA